MAVTKILLTGFEPFGGYCENSSWAVAVKVSALDVEGVVAEQMPVSFNRVGVALREAVKRHKPDVIMMLGQSALTDAVKLERVAINLMDSANADNDGYQPNEEPIYQGENNALFTTLPIKQLRDAVEQLGTPAKLSSSAGLYVCNRLYYEALRLCQGTSMQALFVHLPLYDGQQHSPVGSKQTLPLENMTNAICTIIKTLTL